VVDKRDLPRDKRVSIKTLERSPSRTDEYIAVRDNSCVLKTNVQTSAWLAAHSEFATPVRLVTTALLELFEDFGGEVCVTIQEDPENGQESVLFEVRTRMDGREARQLLRRFVRESLPEAAVPFRDEMVFSVSPIRKNA
jgi:hypothetical protein